MRFPLFSQLGSLGLRRTITIVAMASVVGLVVGYASAALTSEDEPASTTNVRPQLNAAARAALDRQRRNVAEPIILAAVFTPATTPNGRRRHRARLTVTVRLRNTRGRPSAATAAPALLVGDKRVKPDPATADLGAKLLVPVPSNSSVSGVLRFETADDVTDSLAAKRPARLRIAELTVPLNVTR